MVGLGLGEIIVLALLGLTGSGSLVQSQPLLWLATTTLTRAGPMGAGAAYWLLLDSGPPPPPPPLSNLPPVPTIAPPPPPAPPSPKPAPRPRP